MKKILFTITFIVIAVNSALAVPAKPVIITVLQKNGTEISIRQNGDEHFHFKTTEDGILITENADGIFEYAKMNEKGEISATGILAKNKEFRSKNEISFINTLYNNVGEISVKIRQERAEQKNLLKKSNAPEASSAVGEKGIAILVNFSDKAFVTPNANTAFSNMLNQQGYSANNAIGSARDYFIATSNGMFQPTFDVYGPYTLPKNMAYYGANDSNGDDVKPEEMVISACQLADAAGVDFSKYDTDSNGYVDNIFVFYAGYAESSGAPANTIWPHRSMVYYNTKFDNVRISDYACSSELRGKNGSKMDGIGTFCHEFSHVLGLPDLYNTGNSYDTNLEQWDVMDMGCYNGPGNDGDIPAMYSAYEMFYAGWLTPEIINQCGDYTLDPLEGSQKKAYLLAKANTHNLNAKNPNATEFYMIENRQKTSYDSYLPGEGLLITRINYNAYKWNQNLVNNSTPKGVEIMKAGSVNSPSTWAFPTSSKTSFAFISATGSGSSANWGKSISNITKNNQTKRISFNYCTTSGLTEIKNNEFEIINSPLNWSVSMENGSYLMEIYAVNGILLKTFNFEKEINISKSYFPNGVYLLKIKDLSNDKSYFSKAIK